MPISPELAPNGLDGLTAADLAAMPADALSNLTPEEFSSIPKKY